MRPLDGINVIEMAGLAPSPYGGMILSDFGADVVIVDRLTKKEPDIPNVMEKNPFDRGKRSIRIDLKTGEGLSIVKRMIEKSDVLIEPYRPGVMEGLGLGPDEALDLNPKLIYARLTGWGQTGPYASMAGHDTNYIALSGALSLFRRKGTKPIPPGNVLGDFAGGGMLCAMGIMLALLERHQSGKGQVVDSAMVDGAANLATFFYGMFAHGSHSLDAGTNLLDTGAPFYEIYETADGLFLSLGAVEARFYYELIRGLELDPESLPQQYDVAKWPEMKALFEKVIKTRTRDEWEAVFKGKDACVAPVLALDEVADHPHNAERKTFLSIDGVTQPAPAPRLSRTPGKADRVLGPRGAFTREVLQEFGYTSEEVDAFLQKEIVENV